MIEIQPLTAEDVPEKCRVEMEAFASHPRIPMMWPRGMTPDLFAFLESSNLNKLRDPTARVFKAVDVDNGQLVGSADWTIALTPNDLARDKPPAADAPPPENWPQDGNWAMRRFYQINAHELLARHLPGKPYLSMCTDGACPYSWQIRLTDSAVLNYLTVQTTHQRQGIGSSLLDWGVEEADKHGISMCLESTPIGLGLYKKYGFREVEIINADMKDFGWTESYDDSDAIRIFMIRHARLKGAE